VPGTNGTTACPPWDYGERDVSRVGVGCTARRDRGRRRGARNGQRCGVQHDRNAAARTPDGRWDHGGETVGGRSFLDGEMGRLPHVMRCGLAGGRRGLRPAAWSTGRSGWGGVSRRGVRSDWDDRRLAGWPGSPTAQRSPFPPSSNRSLSTPLRMNHHYPVPAGNPSILGRRRNSSKSRWPSCVARGRKRHDSPAWSLGGSVAGRPEMSGDLRRPARYKG